MTAELPAKKKLVVSGTHSNNHIQKPHSRHLWGFLFLKTNDKTQAISGK